MPAPTQEGVSWNQALGPISVAANGHEFRVVAEQQPSGGEAGPRRGCQRQRLKLHLLQGKSAVRGLLPATPAPRGRAVGRLEGLSLEQRLTPTQAV